MDQSKKKERLYDALVQELDGHAYVPKSLGVYRCYHEAHGLVPSLNCWRASAQEFLDNQNCGVSLVFRDDGEPCSIVCDLPKHHDRKDHEGDIMENGRKRGKSRLSWPWDIGYPK